MDFRTVFYARMQEYKGLKAYSHAPINFCNNYYM